MENVIVLKTFTEIVGYTFGFNILAIVLLAVAVITAGICIYIFFTSERSERTWQLFFVPLVIGLLSLPVFATSTPVEEIHKEVYIHGTIDMNEFQNHYEIISQDGAKYIVKDIE